MGQQFTPDLEQAAISGLNLTRPELKVPGTEGATSAIHLPDWKSPRKSAQIERRIRPSVAGSGTSVLPLEGWHSWRSRRLNDWRVPTSRRVTAEVYVGAPPQSPQNSQWPPPLPPQEHGVTPYGSGGVTGF